MKDATKFHFLSNIYKTWVIGKNIFYVKLLWKKLNKATVYWMNPWPLLDFLCLCSACFVISNIDGVGSALLRKSIISACSPLMD